MNPGDLVTWARHVKVNLPENGLIGLVLWGKPGAFPGVTVLWANGKSYTTWEKNLVVLS